MRRFWYKVKRKQKNKKKSRTLKQMGILTLFDALISVTEDIVTRLLASSPDATQLAALSNRVSTMAATLDAAP